MVVINYSEFRKNLKENLDKAYENNDIIIVSRAQNKNVVVISLDEYNSCQETNYLLSSSNNRQRLEQAIKRNELGIIESHDPIEE